MKVLVTGITGTLGQALTPFLLGYGYQINGYSRDELKQTLIKPNKRITLYLGDVRDRDRLIEASRNVDQIYHLAALKHVDKIEENPEEAIKTNVFGTDNVLHAQRVNKIPRVVLASTDKACLPINAYGCTKALAEKLVLRNPNNIVCRYGNVLGSRGSVIPKFIESIKKEKTIYITDRKMTRFFIEIENAAKFVFMSSLREVGGLCIPEMKAVPVLNMALQISEMLGVKSPKIVEIGIRAGEKVHENLRTKDEGKELISSDRSIWFEKKELEKLIKYYLDEIK